MAPCATHRPRRHLLLSSHLLCQIEVVADGLVLIGSGRIVAKGTTSDLLQSSGTLACSREHELVAAALASGVSFSPVGIDGLLAHAEAEQVGKIVWPSAYRSWSLVRATFAGLEDIFLELTAKFQRETTSPRQPAGAMS